MRIMDVEGRILKQVSFAGSTITQFGSELVAGTYLVEVKQGIHSKTLRIVKY